MKKIATSVRLTPEAKRNLKQIARRFGLSQSGVLEMLLRENASRHPDVHREPWRTLPGWVPASADPFPPEDHQAFVDARASGFRAIKKQLASRKKPRGSLRVDGQEGQK